MSRLTDFLKLHIWEIPKDNNEKFNYTKTIADNFEKIDAGLQNAVNKFTEPLSYKGSALTYADLPTINTNGDIYTVTSENKNYIWNGTEWEEYSSNIDLTPIEEQLKTTQATDIAEELLIPNTAPVNGKLDIKSGKSDQVIRSGKNKFNKYGNLNYPSTFNQNKTTLLNDGTLQTTANYSQWASSGYQLLNIKNNTEYMLSGELISSTGEGQSAIAIVAVYGYDTSWKVISAGQLVKTGNFTLLFNTEEYTDFFISLNANGTTGTSYSAIFDKIQIEEGKKVTDYEPYGASPSPDYPSPIRNVGDNINILNIETALEEQYNTAGTLQTVDRYIQENDKIKISYSNVSAGRFFFNKQKLKADTYTYSFKALLSEDATDLQCVYSVRNFTNATDLTNQTLATLNKSKNNICVTFTLEEEAEVSISIQPYSNNSKTLYIEELQLKQGKVAQPFTPYGCGSVNLKVQNKNLFNKDTITKGYLLNRAGENVVNASYGISDYIKVKAGDTIAVQKVDSWYAVLYDINKKYIGNPENTAIITIKNDGYIRYSFQLANLELVQIEKNIEVSEYVEHQEQVISVPLPEGIELCKIGNYKDYIYKENNKWYLVKNIKKTTITNENVQTLVTNKSSAYDIPAVFIPKTELGFKTSWASEVCLMNKYKEIVYSQDLADKTFAFTYNQGSCLVFDNRFTDLETARELLIGTEIYTALATPIITEIIDVDTLEALYQLEHLKMYEGYTSIECIDEIKPDIQVEYSYNNEINKYYGTKIDELSSEVHKLKKQVEDLTAMVLSM